MTFYIMFNTFARRNSRKESDVNVITRLIHGCCTEAPSLFLKDMFREVSRLS